MANFVEDVEREFSGLIACARLEIVATCEDSPRAGPALIGQEFVDLECDAFRVRLTQHGSESFAYVAPRGRPQVLATLGRTLRALGVTDGPPASGVLTPGETAIAIEKNFPQLEDALGSKNYESVTMDERRLDGEDHLDHLYRIAPDVDVALSVGRLMWPEFVEYNGFVFIAEAFDPRRFEEDLTVHGHRIEEGINTIYLDHLVGDPDAAVPRVREVCEQFASHVRESWLAKATRDFPGKSFEVEFSWYQPEVPSDLGIFLRQRTTSE